ncbi:MAG: sel1 repeat family protein [Alphaproteobacteria bacterium]|nr:sel1 repeat family protein [Alphaproteobacteria bacterium]
MLKKLLNTTFLSVCFVCVTLAAPLVYAQETTSETSATTKTKKKEASAEQIQEWQNMALGYYNDEGRFFSKDYKKAMEYFKKAALHDDATSLYYLGNMYNEGYGVEQDEHNARLLFKRASELGHADAQMLLGVMLIMDGMILRDIEKRDALYAEAVQWLEKSAAQKNAEALFWLGDMQRKGFGIEKNEEQGVKRILESSKANNPNALAMEAAFYWQELAGVKKDLKRAHALMYKSQLYGNDQARLLLKEIEEEMNATQREEAKALAVEAQKKFRKQNK